ncbi:MAG TPA: response regulator [Candidatus Acidoferrales bacterium]|nr:response regulator [Candidatus Acidoferrales bacterium]
MSGRLHQQPAKARGNRRATVLVVNDQRRNREYLATVLGQGGHRVLQASDGIEALTMARVACPDVVITDTLTPSMDGFEFVRRLRVEPELADTRVIFFTASYRERETRGLARACGVEQVIVHPAEPAAILSAIGAALGRPAIANDTPPSLESEPGKAEEAQSVRSETARGAADQWLHSLVEAGHRLASAREPRRLLEVLCSAAREFSGARFVAAGLVDGDRLEPFVMEGISPESARHRESPGATGGLVGRVIAGGRPLRLASAEADETVARLPAAHQGRRSFLGVPLGSSERRYGVLYFVEKLGAAEFSQRDESVAWSLGEQAAAAYENIQRYQELNRQVAELESEMERRREAEEALEASQEQLRLLLDSTAEAILGVDTTGHCTFCNPSSLRLLGYGEPEELLGRELHGLLHHSRADGSPYPAAECVIHSALERGERIHVADETYWRKDGSSFPAECWLYPVKRDGTRLGAVVTFLDITERRTLEQRFLQAQKMEAVGRLAGGVAHDFNNLLCVILGYAELLERLTGRNDTCGQMLGEITRAANRASKLTQQLLAFSRQQLLQVQAFDLNELTERLQETLRRMATENIRLAIRARAVAGRVKADPAQIEQAVMNLVMNACDAMPHGGTLTIETTNVEIDAATAGSQPPTTAGRYVAVEVSDTGCGMGKEVMSHLFEPFFTTKGTGVGTGLGLAAVEGIVKQSGGFVRVTSAPGKGSTFRLCLPQAEEAGEGTSGTETQEPAAGGTETILLIEDSDSVRGITRTMLESNGYSVLEADRPSEALELALRFKDPIHLAVTDVILPEMNGRVVAERITALHPETRVMFISGYTSDALSQQGLIESGIIFLAKPFTEKALLGKVRAALNAPRGPDSAGPGKAPAGESPRG